MLNWLRRKTVLASQIQAQQEEDFSDASEVYQYFTDLTGIDFEQKESITTPKLIRFAKSFGYCCFGELLKALRLEPSVREALINLLTVNETYFFREKGQLDFLVSHFLGSFGTLRILCAPGSTGEEAYSIAIILAEHGVSLSSLQIVSIDINTEATERAILGVYSHRALHRLSDELKERYFVTEDKYYRVRDSIKQAVAFRSCNIFETEFLELGVFDIVFSRNMLIYFDQFAVDKAIKRFIRLARTDKSCFFFGHADLLITPARLQEHFDDGIKYYTLKK